VLNIEVILNKILSKEYSRPVCYDAVYIDTVYSPYFSRRSFASIIACPLFQGGWLFSNHPDDGSSKLLRNAGIDIPIYTIAYSTRVVYLPALLWKSQWHEFLFLNRMAAGWLIIIRYEFMVGQMTDLPILVDDWLTDVLASIMIRCLMNFQLARLITDWIINWWIKLCP
jgi:hypothetical protein